MVNLALALRNVSRKSVLLVDWRRPLGDVVLFLGLPKKRVLEPLLPCADGLDEHIFNTALKEYRPGVWVLPGAIDPASADQMNRKTLSNVLKMALVKADYVLVDSGPLLSWEDPPLIAKRDNREEVNLSVLTPELTLCVLTPELTSVERAANAVETINAMDYDCWLLLNRYGMPGGIPREQIEARLGDL